MMRGGTIHILIGQSCPVISGSPQRLEDCDSWINLNTPASHSTKSYICSSFPYISIYAVQPVQPIFPTHLSRCHRQRETGSITISRSLHDLQQILEQVGMRQLLSGEPCIEASGDSSSDPLGGVEVVALDL